MAKASDECYLPRPYATLVRTVLVRIDLDPASCKRANRVIGARRIFTIEDDGLARRWRGKVYVNWPFSEPALWVDKLIEEYDAGRVTEAIALGNSRSSSRWFRKLSSRFWRCEPHRRIRFYGPATSGGNGRLDQVFFYLGPSPERFAATFGTVGSITPPSVSVTENVTRLCEICRRPLEGRRRHAKTCSDACKQRLHRSRAVAA